ncbi:MAG: uracil-DNA glycosylase [Planctomycetes bacterium]|nr:uracil-DNA glycosylase [Planctomycetota bacterium]
MSHAFSDPALAASAREFLLEELSQLGVDYLAPRQIPQAPSIPDSLEQIQAEVAACQNCELACSRTQTVPGSGSASARVVFVGEAPGAEEDLQGQPFVGPAGQLLDKIIESGMGLRRADVFILNILKCRPPGNRDPLATEKQACTPFLQRQLNVLRPDIVICLGRHAANYLLGSDQSLGQLRGRLHQSTSGIPILATYHPAYLLRTPSAKVDCWQDIQIAMNHLGLKRPGAAQ